eukprot:gene3106-3035_t
MLITTPWWVEKAITNAMQSKTHQSALQYAQQLSARLDAAQTHYDRAVSATDSPRDDFEPIARQWLKNSSHVLRVQLLDANGHVLKSFTRQEGDAHDPTTFKPLNRISLAHALELQTPTYSALYKQHDQQVVDLFIPHDGPSPVAYVLTLDTQPWTQVTGENKETLLTVEVVPYQTQNFLDVSRYILNFPEWEGLWSLQFQSADPMLGILMLGEMSASLAHEINQPLTSIANYAVAGQLQLQRHDAQSPVLPLLQKIQEQSQRAAQVLVAVRGMTQPGPMDQVILNLVKNSIQALDSITHSSKRIRIQVTGDQEMLHIQVADNGPGIQPENVPRIFDSFFTTKAQGLGIGLKLCRSVIERLNGRLTLKNNSPRGVGFMISLPLLSDTTQQAQPT